MNNTKSLPGFFGGVSTQAPTLRLDSQVQSMTNCITSIQAGTERRPPSRLFKTLSGASAPTGPLSTAFITEMLKSPTEGYQLVITSDPTDPVNVYNLSTGVKGTVTYPVSPTSGAKAYLLAGAGAPAVKLKALTLEDYTFISNNQVTVTAGSTTAAVVNPVLIFHVARGQGGTNYDVTITFSDQNQQDVTRSISYTAPAGLTDTTTIALGIAAAIDTDFLLLAAYPQFRIFVHESFVFLAKNSWVSPGVAFTTLLSGSADDGLGGAGIRCLSLENLSGASFNNFVNISQSFELLPPKLPKGTGGCYYSGALTTTAVDTTAQVVKIQGETAGDSGYYVKYDVEKNAWVETTKPGVNTGFNNATLPAMLVKTGVNTFEVRPFSSNGTVLQLATRLVGDDDSNPVPSFQGQAIQAVVYYKDRLGFLASDSLCMSRAGSPFNFWATTATDVLDDDPIDTPANSSGGSAVTLVNAIVHNEKLLINASGHQQFVLTSSQAILSPKSSSLDMVTAFDLSTTCPPVGSGPNVYFAESSSRLSFIREFYIQEDGVTRDALNIASHIEGYMGALERLWAYPKGNILVSKSGNNLYPYQYLWGSEGKVQSAFHKWLLGDVMSGTTSYTPTVHGGAVFGDDLCLLVSVNSVAYILKIALDNRETYTGLWQFHMDFTEALVGVYSALTGLTTFTPTVPVGPTHVLVEALTGKELESTVVGSGLTVVGDHSATYVLCGIPFTSSIGLSQIVLRDPRTNVAILKPAMRLKWLELAFENTGNFSVTCVPRNTTSLGETTRTYPTTEFDWMLVGEDSLDTVRLKSSFDVPMPFRALLFTENRGATVTILTSGYLPWRLLNAEVGYS